MSLKVARLPFPATLQDFGRVGWLRYGVPRSGAFDRLSLANANRLLENPDHAPGLEITLLGGLFVALTRIEVSVAGAQSSVHVDGEEVGVYHRAKGLAAALEAGQTLEIGPAQSGLRVYLCLRGGIGGKPVLGSVSGTAVVSGAELTAGVCEPLGKREALPEADGESVRIMPGPHATEFDLNTLVESTYTVTNHSNRVGIRLDGPSLTPQPDRPSEPACIGAIQISNNGQPIILGPDGPTIGGYPIVAVVRKSCHDKLGQLRPGDQVQFELS